MTFASAEQSHQHSLTILNLLQEYDEFMEIAYVTDAERQERRKQEIKKTDPAKYNLFYKK